MQGKNFVKKGVLYYDYTTQRARADYYDWCIPLFDGPSGGPNLYNETCSFLMTPKGAFFIRFAKPITHDTHDTHDTHGTHGTFVAPLPISRTLLPDATRSAP